VNWITKEPDKAPTSVIPTRPTLAATCRRRRGLRPSLDHLVSACKQGRRYVEAERLGDLSKSGRLISELG